MALRTRRLEAKEPNHERWLLTYADLITLLLVFFIVMYAISTADLNKFARLSASLQRAFSVGVLQGVDTTAPIDAGMSGSSILETERGDGDIQAASNELARLERGLAQMVERRGLAGYIETRQVREGLVIRMSGALLFDSGKADLRPDGRELLQEIARLIRPLPNRLRVDGHTDNIPPEMPQYPTNWELSAARSVAVARFLVEQGGIAAQRVYAAAFAEFHPLTANDSREARALNRRAEILVLAPEPR